MLILNILKIANKISLLIYREDVRNLILGYPSLKNKIIGNFLGEIHRINPEILGYPRIPGSPLTTSLIICGLFTNFQRKNRIEQSTIYPKKDAIKKKFLS